MTFYGLIAGIFCFSCWYIKGEAKTIDCPGVPALDKKRSDFFNHVKGEKYWTVKKTGDTEYEFHPLGVKIDTLIKFLFPHNNLNNLQIDNYYNDPESSENTSIVVNHELHCGLQVDDEKIIYESYYKYSKLLPQQWSPDLRSASNGLYYTQIYSNYEFALIDQKDNYNVLIFQSCSVDESDTWYLIKDEILRNATGPDGSLNAEIEGIHVDHMPKLLFHPFGLGSL